MPNGTIDLRQIKSELKGTTASVPETPAFVSEKLPNDENFARAARSIENHRAAHRVAEQDRNDEEEHSEHTPLLRKITGALSHTHGDVIFEWEALEFEPDVGRALTIFFVGLAIALGGIAALFLKSFIFAVLLLIGGGLVIARAMHAPHIIQSAVTSRGVKVADRFYDFETLESFWIDYDPPFSNDLLLESQKYIMPVIRIPLESADPLELRRTLLRFLKEQKHEADTIDAVARFLGF